ncbi:MAG: molybdopterin-dependent oxidoreductase [bacterium]
MARLKRRDFLKLGVASTSLLAVGGLGQALQILEGGKQVSRTTGKLRKSKPSTCLGCYARCGIFGYVEYGRLVKIGGNRLHPNSRGRLCAIGQAGINQVYDPDRILYPLKRVGVRGGGRWKRISWEEAYDEVARRLRELRDSGHPEQFVFLSERDVSTQDFVRRFLYAYGTPYAFNHADLGGSNKKIAHQLTWGADIDINDVAYTGYILNFGCNPYEAHILRTSFTQRIAEARTERMFDGRVHNRAKMVTFDVRLSQTAGRSDEWFPVMPGTDGAVALAMAHVIMKHGLYDRDFVTRWTNVTVAQLRDHLRPYTPQWAEEISGVRASEIERIAYEFATVKPATTLASGGVNEHANGVYNERCVAMLNAITGNIDIKGGFCLPRYYQLEEPYPRPAEPATKSELVHSQDFPLLPHEVPQKIIPAIREGKLKVGVYMTYKANPSYSNPNYHLTLQVLKSQRYVPFYVAVDSFMSESAALADIILPEATYLERWGLESPPTFEFVPFVSLRQPVIPPRGESVAFTDMCIELAKRIGGGMEKYFDFESTEDYLRTSLSKIDGLVQAGGLDYLKEHGLWYDPQAEPEYRSYEKRGFNTPSGKFEIYSKRLEKAGFHPLPVYEPVAEHRRLRTEQLILTTFQWNVHTHGYTANAMWLSEIVHDNPMWINPETARARGLKTGDSVIVTSEAGSLKAKVWVTEGIHPRVVAISDNCGHWEYGRIAQGKRFQSEEPNTELVWWGEQGQGVNPKSIIPISSDPIGGGQCWMDTVVTITKA